MRTLAFVLGMSAFDPKPTSAREALCRAALAQCFALLLPWIFLFLLLLQLLNRSLHLRKQIVDRWIVVEHADLHHAPSEYSYCVPISPLIGAPNSSPCSPLKRDICICSMG